MSAATRPISNAPAVRLRAAGLGITAIAGTGVLLAALAGSLASRPAPAPAPAPAMHDHGSSSSSRAVAPVVVDRGSSDGGGTIVIRFPK
jgi:hypothetical protein